MKQINGINIARINNAVHIVYVENVVTAAEENERLAKETGKKIAALKAAVAEERKYLGQSRKSDLSAAIAAADMARDQLYKAYRRCVSAYKRMPDEAMAEPGKRLARHLKSYKLDTTDDLRSETGMMHRFLATLKEKYAADVEKLSLTSMVEAMEKQTNTVSELMYRRTDEMAKLTKGAMKRARKRTNVLYREFVRVVNALAVVNDDTDYAPFIDYVNQVIKEQKRNAS